jgi:hypothetical protein
VVGELGEVVSISPEGVRIGGVLREELPRGLCCWGRAAGCRVEHVPQKEASGDLYWASLIDVEEAERLIEGLSERLNGG